MASQFDQYQETAKRAGWVSAWQEMLRFVTPIIDRAGRYEDTRSAVMMRDLCTSQLFLSGAPGGVEPGKLSPDINTLGVNMTISVSVSAHADTAEAEDQMLDKLRSAVKAMADSGQVYSASASTSHHGTVDLNVPKAEVE